MHKLFIRLVNGRDLHAADKNGSSDPYVVFQIGREQAKSKILNETLNPTWNEDIELPVHYLSDVLEFTVYEYDNSM
jgi:Ca2+-dependent lipid-binding protein